MPMISYAMETSLPLVPLRGSVHITRMAALRAKTAPDEAEDEDFGDSKARTTTKYGAVLAATLWDGADFPAFCVVVASQTPGMRRSFLLEIEKIGSRRCYPRDVSRP